MERKTKVAEDAYSDCKIQLSLRAWDTVQSRSLYFKNFDEKRSAFNSSDKVKLSKCKTCATIAIQYPSFITTDEGIIHDFFRLISKETITRLDFSSIVDLQAFIYLMDHFNLTIWDIVFDHYFNELSFLRRNLFFKVLYKSFPSDHPLVTDAIAYIRNILDISAEKLKGFTNAPAYVKYFRSVARTREHARSSTHTQFQCAICQTRYETRKNLVGFHIDNGFRLHCCATTICNYCLLDVNTRKCQTCETMYDDQGFIDPLYDTSQSGRKRGQVRDTLGIPRDAIIRVHPMFAVQHGPRFIPVPMQ